MRTAEGPRPSRRIIFTVIAGLIVGGAAGGGVAIGLYPPAVGVALAAMAGLATGLGVKRAARRP